MNIYLLCKVVDNYGDIGFVYRLSRSLSRLNQSLNLTLVVSNLESFSTMARGIDPLKPVQTFNGWTVLDWNESEVCKKEFSRNTPDYILECFQCGRPEWLEEILFAEDNKRIFKIINVEYLTAEEWADDCHLLKSGTRSSYVKKINFFPGFTPKTGGLVLDEEFMESITEDKNSIRQKALEKVKRSNLSSVFNCAEFYDGHSFNTVFFSYEKDFTMELKALHLFESSQKKGDSAYKVNIFCPAGYTYDSITASLKKLNLEFSLIKLPHLEQTEWDALLCMMDFNFIRGEDSFARACLSGVPFLWHAYVQEDEFQLVKVNAFVNRMKPFFSEKLFDIYKTLSISYNRNESIQCGPEAWEVLSEYEKIECSGHDRDQLLLELLNNYVQVRESFRKFGSYLVSNGNLGEKLLSQINAGFLEK